MWPEVLIGEVSGGIPAGGNWKTWYDFLMQLVIGSRDCILRVVDKCGDQAKNTVMYSFQLSGKLEKGYKYTRLFLLFTYFWRRIQADDLCSGSFQRHVARYDVG